MNSEITFQTIFRVCRVTSGSLFKMSYTDPKWLSALLAKHSRDNSVVDVLSVQTEPAVGVGDNYASVITRATLKVVLGSGRVSTKSIIIKKSVDDLPEEVGATMSGIFMFEGVVYSEILSKFTELIHEYRVPYDTLWPDCIFSSHNLIVFEDLKTSGFTLTSRHSGLDVEHSRLVFVNMARFHSLSLVALKRGIVYPNILPTFAMLETSVGKSYVKTSLKALADEISDKWTDQWSKVGDKIKDMIDNIIPTLNTLYNQKPKLSVINHGDCWISNMMFKYNSQGCPEQLKLVDYQITFYNSYGWDLIYFLYSSIHPKLIKSNIDSFIDIYCKEFSDNLERFGCDPSQAPTVDDVNEELKRLSPYALITACSVLPITANPGDVKLTIEDLISHSAKYRLIFEDKTFEMTMKEMFTYFIDQGYL